MSPPPRTWMSSSLELNSDTSTFSPSETLVSETHSRPETKTCASQGRSRFRPDFNTLTRLKEGCRGPRFLFLASFATSITSSQHFAKNEEEKGDTQAQEIGLWSYTCFEEEEKRMNKHTSSSISLRLDQHSRQLPGVSDQQWPMWTLFQVLNLSWGPLSFLLVDTQRLIFTLYTRCSLMSAFMIAYSWEWKRNGALDLHCPRQV